MRQLFLDLDGVLADFDGAYEQMFGGKIDRTTIDPPGFWEHITSAPTFYLDLPVLPDALELWRGAKELHLNPVILTGIAKSVPDCAQQKRAWVDEHIEPGASMICCFSKDKRIHARRGDVLIDDWLQYRHLWEEMGGIFILHTSAPQSLAWARRIFQPEDKEMCGGRR